MDKLLKLGGTHALGNLAWKKRKKAPFPIWTEHHVVLVLAMPASVNLPSFSI
jgi:hypothetical protein